MAKLGKVIGILIVVLLLIRGLYPNSVVRAQNDNYTIEVDEFSKTVHSGEEAVFTWYLENNEQFKTFEFYPGVNEDRNDFYPESIILNPGEKGIVIHTFNTTGLNSSFVNVISITWLISLCGPQGILENPSVPSLCCSGRLEVIIFENEMVNDTNEIINDTNENSNEGESELNLSPLLLIGIIILVALPLSYFIFKKRKFRK